MPTPTSKPESNLPYKPALDRIRSIHRRQTWLFYASCLLVLVGVVAILANPDSQLGFYLTATGLGLGAVTVIPTYFIYPRLRCPRCGKRFFLSESAWHVIEKINTNQKHCRHCGLGLDLSENHH